ncbi:MAG TPA: CHASE2 domain-containing protein, partial [Thioploca sp.]|nr:CHASE2 domain-containing protein [Thioploca sp.]
MPHFVRDEAGVPILTILAAQAYAKSPPATNLEALTDSIVVIGGSYRDGRDIYLTPLGNMPGSLIIINAIHSLLQYNIIDPLPIGAKIMLIAILIFFMSLAFARFTPGKNLQGLA